MFSLPRLGDQRLQLGDVEVALEGGVALDLERLVGEQLAIRPPASSMWALVVVKWKFIGTTPLLGHEDLADDVLGGAALVDGQEVLGAEDLHDRLLQPGVGSRAGVGVVGHHHRGDLLVAHGVGAAVGEHVEEDVAVLQQEGVEAGAFHGLAGAPRRAAG